MQIHFGYIGFTMMNDILISRINYAYKPSERDSICQRPFYIWP